MCKSLFKLVVKFIMKIFSTSWALKVILCLSVDFVFCCFLFGLDLTSEVISLYIWCLLVAVVLWPVCCHTDMPCCRHRTWHPTLTCHSIQIRGRPVVVLTINVEHQTGRHNHPLKCLRSDTNEKSFPKLTHTANTQLHEAVVMASSIKSVQCWF